ncbi:UNVERIFIED_CONTAM: putative protein ycf68, partial [Sesamum indicum]
QAHELIILGRNKSIGSPLLRPHVPPCGTWGPKKRKERDGVSLAFGIAGSQWEARTTGYYSLSLVERAPDIASLCLGCEGSQPHGSSMCSSAPDPEMWIIQGTLAMAYSSCSNR